MTLTVYNELVQRSDEWYEVRRGMVTASTVGQLITTRALTGIDFDCPTCEATPNAPCIGKRDGAPIKTLHPERAEAARNYDGPATLQPADNDYSRSLTLLLAAERITGWTAATYISDDMWRGIDDEPFARQAYSEHFAPVTEAGFMVEDRWGFQIGCSPDGLVGDDGMIEIKSRRPKAQLATIIAGAPPADTMAQLQCALLVSGREWIDYISYSGGMPLWRYRIEPQPEWVDVILQAVAAVEQILADTTQLYRELVADLPMTERRLQDEMVV